MKFLLRILQVYIFIAVIHLFTALGDYSKPSVNNLHQYTYENNDFKSISQEYEREPTNSGNINAGVKKLLVSRQSQDRVIEIQPIKNKNVRVISSIQQDDRVDNTKTSHWKNHNSHSKETVSTKINQPVEVQVETSTQEKPKNCIDTKFVNNYNEDDEHIEVQRETTKPNLKVSEIKTTYVKNAKNVVPNIRNKKLYLNHDNNPNRRVEVTTDLTNSNDLNEVAIKKTKFTYPNVEITEKKTNDETKFIDNELYDHKTKKNEVTNQGVKTIYTENTKVIRQRPVIRKVHFQTSSGSSKHVDFNQVNGNSKTVSSKVNEGVKVKNVEIDNSNVKVTEKNTNHVENSNNLESNNHHSNKKKLFPQIIGDVKAKKITVINSHGNVVSEKTNLNNLNEQVEIKNEEVAKTNVKGLEVQSVQQNKKRLQHQKNCIDTRFVNDDCEDNERVEDQKKVIDSNVKVSGIKTIYVENAKNVVPNNRNRKLYLNYDNNPNRRIDSTRVNQKVTANVKIVENQIELPLRDNQSKSTKTIKPTNKLSSNPNKFGGQTKGFGKFYSTHASKELNKFAAPYELNSNIDSDFTIRNYNKKLHTTNETTTEDGLNETNERGNDERYSEPEKSNRSNGDDRPNRHDGLNESNAPDAPNEPDAPNGSDPSNEPDSPNEPDETDEPNEHDASNENDSPNEPDETDAPNGHDEPNGHDPPNENDPPNRTDNPYDPDPLLSHYIPNEYDGTNRSAGSNRSDRSDWIYNHDSNSERLTGLDATIVGPTGPNVNYGNSNRSTRPNGSNSNLVGPTGPTVTIVGPTGPNVNYGTSNRSTRPNRPNSNIVGPTGSTVTIVGPTGPHVVHENSNRVNRRGSPNELNSHSVGPNGPRTTLVGPTGPSIHYGNLNTNRNDESSVHDVRLNERRDYSVTLEPSNYYHYQNVQNECGREGYFLDNKICNKFYQCTRVGNSLKLYSFSCTGNLVFDLKNLVCDYPPPNSSCA